MLIVSYEISLKGLNILFLPPYYSETLGRFKYDVSGLFDFTSIKSYAWNIIVKSIILSL